MTPTGTTVTREWVLSHFPPDIGQRFFGALQILPQEKVYEGLQPDEVVVFNIHRHFLALIWPLLGGLALLLVPIVLLAVAFLFPLGEITLRYLIVVIWFLLIFVLHYFLSVFVLHATNVYIVTTERILDLDTDAVAKKAVRELELMSVVGVEYVLGGGLFLGGINQGTVMVATTGGSVLAMKNTPMAGEVALVIGALAEQAARRYRPGKPGNRTIGGGAI